MILDQFLIFFDHTAAEDSGVSAGVNLSAYAGRNEALSLTVLLNGAKAVNLSATLQESDDQSAWETLASFPLAKPDKLSAILSFALPRAAKKKFVRLAYALTGPAAGLKLWAGITRDHFAPYAPAQYIDAGKVVA